MLKLVQAGVPAEAHHHEVTAGGQCEIDLRFGSLVEMDDQLRVYKYAVKNTAMAHGKGHPRQGPGSLPEALAALETCHHFLLAGNVFTRDVLETWVDYQRTREIDPIRLRPHPYELYRHNDA